MPVIDELQFVRAFPIFIGFHRNLVILAMLRALNSLINIVMQCIAKFQNALQQVEALTEGLLSESGRAAFNEKKAQFSEELSRSRYMKVPIVGVFSAGKSSLLNVFVEKPTLLPINTMPETAVAYELYYDTNERVELYRDGQLLESCTLDKIGTLTTKPGDIAHVYCQSEVVKQLQDKGIILVDMPGIDSGIEQHDAAVCNYIQEGTAFVLMVDVEQGSLRTSTITFLKELKSYQFYPSVFITKTDKKPEAEVQEVKDYVAFQLQKISEGTPTVGTVCSANNNLQDFRNYVFSLDAEAMLSAKLRVKFDLIVKEALQQLSTRVDIRQKDVQNVDASIAALVEEINKSKQNLPQVYEGADSPEKSTQDILDNVAKALQAQAPTMAQMLMKGDSVEEVKALMISTVRAEIIRSLKEESEQYVEALGKALQEASSDIANINLNSDFLNDYADVIDIVKQLVVFLPVGGVWARIVTFILANLPVISSIINWLFGKSKEDIEREVLQKLQQAIPTITEELRDTITKLVTDNQKRIEEAMQKEYVGKMEHALDGLNEKKADAEKSKESVNQEIATLQNAIDQLEKIQQEL